MCLQYCFQQWLGLMVLGASVWDNLGQLHFVGKKGEESLIISTILSEILSCRIFEQCV